MRGTSIYVEIYDNRVVIVNPGGLPSGITKANFGKEYNFPQILDSILSFPEARNCDIKIISQFKGDATNAAEEIQCRF